MESFVWYRRNKALVVFLGGDQTIIIMFFPCQMLFLLTGEKSLVRFRALFRDGEGQSAMANSIRHYKHVQATVRLLASKKLPHHYTKAKRMREREEE